MKVHVFIGLSFFFFCSCDSKRFYEDSVDVGEEGWRETQVLEYKVEVPEDNQSYDILYTVRYSNNYPNYNLYVKTSISDTSGKMIVEKLQGMDLFMPTTGSPYGNGFGGSYDHSILGLPNLKFPHKGLYIFKIKQYMRQDPLKGITAFGIRLEHTKD